MAICTVKRNLVNIMCYVSMHVIIWRVFVPRFCSSSHCMLSLTEVIIVVLSVVLCSVTELGACPVVSEDR